MCVWYIVCMCDVCVCWLCVCVCTDSKYYDMMVIHNNVSVYIHSFILTNSSSICNEVYSNLLLLG